MLLYCHTTHFESACVCRIAHCLTACCNKTVVCHARPVKSAPAHKECHSGRPLLVAAIMEKAYEQLTVQDMYNGRHPIAQQHQHKSCSPPIQQSWPSSHKYVHGLLRTVWSLHDCITPPITHTQWQGNAVQLKLNTQEGVNTCSGLYNSDGNVALGMLHQE